MASHQKQHQHHPSDFLIDTSVFYIDSLTQVHIGLDSKDLFWPKILFVNGTDQIPVNIQFLQRLYSLYPYFSSLYDDLDGVVILQDEYTTVRVLQAYSNKIYLVIESPQTHLEDSLPTICTTRKKEIWMSFESAKQLYKLKNVIFDNLYRKLILTRPRIVREVKMLLKHIVNNNDDDDVTGKSVQKDKLTLPKNKVCDTQYMIYFHEIVKTEYISKCLDFASRVIFVKNNARIKVNFNSQILNLLLFV